MMNDAHCKSRFKSGGDCTTVQAYTGAWVFINQLERSRAVLSSIK